jgi:hypothetical protein
MSRLLILMGLLAACGNPAPVMPAFVPDAVGDGAALFTRGDLTGKELNLTVRGRKLGAVLGYAFTLELEGLTLNGEPDVEPVLGPNAFGEALYLSRVNPSSFVAAGARQGPAAGDRVVDDETVLARMKLTLGDGPAQVRLSRTSVRRANGDGVVISVGGGGVR